MSIPPLIPNALPYPFEKKEHPDGKKASSEKENQIPIEANQEDKKPLPPPVLKWEKKPQILNQKKEKSSESEGLSGDPFYFSEEIVSTFSSYESSVCPPSFSPLPEQALDVKERVQQLVQNFWKQLGHFWSSATAALSLFTKEVQWVAHGVCCKIRGESPHGCEPQKELESPLEKALLLDVNQFLEKGGHLRRPGGGASGAYFVGEFGLFKPDDEEAYAPNNPFGYVGELGKQRMRHGITAGEQSRGEVAAYLIDSQRFSRVPVTLPVALTHSDLFEEKEGFRTQWRRSKSKRGSLQQFVQHRCTLSEISYEERRKIPAQEVQRIGILDVCLLNTDRHSMNLLVRGENEGMELIPIDHGLCLPQTLDQMRFSWIRLHQAKEPFTRESLEHIASIDLEKNEEIFTQLGFGEKAVLHAWASTYFLKEAAQKGWTLKEVGEFFLRPFESPFWIPEGRKDKSLVEVKKTPPSPMERLFFEAECAVRKALADLGYWDFEEEKAKSLFQGRLRKKVGELIEEAVDQKREQSQENDQELAPQKQELHLEKERGSEESSSLHVPESLMIWHTV